MGLLAAHGAFKRGCQSILLLEQAREFAKVGQGIVLERNAVRVMKMIAPKAFEKLESPFPIDDSALDPVYAFDGSVKYLLPRSTGDDRAIATKWWMLQRVLIDDLDDNIEIRNDASVTTLDHFSDYVQIKYITNRPRRTQIIDEKWGHVSKEDPARPSEEHIVYGRVVIGADGIRSQCRNEIYRAIGGDQFVPYAHPVYTGMMKVDVSIDEIPKGTEDAYKELCEMFPSGFTHFGTSDASARLPIMILIRLPENKDTIMFMVYMAQSLASHPEEFLSELAGIVYSEVEIEPLRILTKALARDANAGNIGAEACPLKMVPLFSYEGFDVEKPPGLVRPFAYKRVFMVGDALHGCPPLMAMGTAMGFEDVCELVDLLADTFKWDEETIADVSDDELRDVAERYRNARSDRLESVVKESTFPEMRTDERVYFPWRNKILDFKPVATGWRKRNKPTGESGAKD